MMKLQTQPKGSSLCGQTTVAMILDKPAADVVAEIFRGHTGSTSYNTKYRALRLAGYEVSDAIGVDARRKWGLPQGKKGFMRIHARGRRNGHAVAFDVDGKIYDPGPTSNVFENVEEMLSWYKNNRSGKWRVHYYAIVE